jgi:hypothetical protein
MNETVKILFHIGVFSIFLMAPASLASSETAGHVGFFYISQVKTDADFEVHNDFQYYYKNITPWLIKNSFSFSYHSAVPITLKLGEDKSLTLQKDDLKGDLGFILSKGDGTHKILYGVHTGVDIMMAVKDFFDITAGAPETMAPASENQVAQKATAKTPDADIVHLIRNSPTPVLICILSGEASFDKRLEATLRQLQSDYKDNILWSYH